MKRYTIGLITGALLAISVMMFMGASSSEVGLYQLSTTNGDATSYIYETIINTKTGKVEKRKQIDQNNYGLTFLLNIKKVGIKKGAVIKPPKGFKQEPHTLAGFFVSPTFVLTFQRDEKDIINSINIISFCWVLSDRKRNIKKNISRI
jgi:hypothetical protein